jgi:hypothetical protein
MMFRKAMLLALVAAGTFFAMPNESDAQWRRSYRNYYGPRYVNRYYRPNYGGYYGGYYTQPTYGAYYQPYYSGGYYQPYYGGYYTQPYYGGYGYGSGAYFGGRRGGVYLRF